MSDFSIETVRNSNGTDQRWLAGPHGLETAKPGTLDLSEAGAAGAVDQFGYIKDGTAVAKLPSGLYGLFDAAATDGHQELAGFVVGDVYVWNSRYQVQTSKKTPIAVLRHGVINAAFLPIVAQRTTVATAASTGDFIFN